MSFRVELIDAAKEDLAGLDHAARLRVVKKLALLEENLEAGQPLGARQAGNLTGFRKLVVGNRQWRIIYRAVPAENRAEVCLIGNRSEGDCYKEAYRRVQSLPADHPARGQMLDVMGEVAELNKVRPSPALTPPAKRGGRRRSRP